MDPRRALLVGGQKRCWEPMLEYLARCGVEVWDHWHEDKNLRSQVSGKVDLAIIISSQVSHALQAHAKSQAEGVGVPTIYVSHNASVFPDQLKKWGVEPLKEAGLPTALPSLPERTSPAFPISNFTTWPAAIAQIKDSTEVPSPSAVAEPQQPTETENKVKEEYVAKEAKKLRSNQVKANEKIEYLRELLRADPGASPNYLIERITERFPGKSAARPGGIAKTLITKIRMEEHGIQVGPGGRVFDKKGQRRPEFEKPREGSTKSVNGAAIKRAPLPSTDARDLEQPSKRTNGGVVARLAPRADADVESSNDRLRQLVMQLRNVMQSAGVEALQIPLDGAIKMRRSQEVDLDV